MALTTVPKIYPVRLGPLRFRSLGAEGEERLGDALETVGAALVPGERSPRPQRIVVPVGGAYEERDHREVGVVLRRQVRQLLENARWKDGGLYFRAGWDPESAAWLSVGGGKLTESQLSWPQGEWVLELDDAYLVGRVWRRRRARRVSIADRADGQTATDSRGELYTTALAPYPTSQVRLVAAVPFGRGLVRGYGGGGKGASGGPQVFPEAYGRLWGLVEAENGEVLSWQPPDVPGDPEIDATIEDIGSVRVWEVPGDHYPPGLAQTRSGDLQPDGPDGYGWIRVLGPLDYRARGLAVDNGWARVTWHRFVSGLAEDRSVLRIEIWGGGAVSGGTDPSARYEVAIPGLDFSIHPQYEVQMLEVTPERAVMCIRALEGDEMRVILQRGWEGPRIEVYKDIDWPRRVYVHEANGSPTRVSPVAVHPMVDSIAPYGGLEMGVAKCQEGVTWNALVEGSGAWEVGEGPLVLQFARPRGWSASSAEIHGILETARWDIRATPTLTDW